MPVELTPEQQRAVERREHSLLVSAGAGTGKTSVLVERFVRAVVEDGAAVDAVLAITFTEKAAAQLRSRVRQGFVDRGERDHARATEGAWISTIHGFCSRILRAHSLGAGIDPEYRVLDELEAERIAAEAFDAALEAFLAPDADPGRLEMAAAYTPDRLADMVRTAYSRLRSRGQRRPELPRVEPPMAAGERERLDQRLADAAAELERAGEGKQVGDAMAALERCRALLERAGRRAANPGDLEKLALSGSAKALKTDACHEYGEALAAYRSFCSNSHEARVHELLRVLLDLYGERYERAKSERSGLDFEDLELIARDLLLSSEAIRESYNSRFQQILVDEFQDTNPLQNEIIELLGRDNLFRVGDERQSIYGFRNADVDVFRTHRDSARDGGQAESISVNFRSRSELLEALNLVFGRVWEHFQPLQPAPAARQGKPRVEPVVDLLMVDKTKTRWEERFAGEEDPFGRGMRSAAPWRACEARLMARRLEELMRAGGWQARDVAVLLRATTHLGIYERALEERGIPTHVVGGRGYWSQQQVADLRAYLAALANPLDGLALYSVLASPFVGASPDALSLLALHARESGRDPWWELSEAFGGNGGVSLSDALPPADRGRLAAFVERFTRERAAVPRVALESVIDRAVTDSGYDRAVLALPAGDRRLANVRKLMRMARAYEAEEGRDLRGFIDFVAERDVIQAREGEAPLEAEEVDAVRLMTIHRSKGLEFPVVCVADLGKDGREDHGPLRLSREGELGLRLARLGGGAVNSERLERLKAEQRERDEEEERRIFHVAMTRAQEHLLLSGATDLEKRPPPAPLQEPMRWVARALCDELPTESGAGELARWQVCRPGDIDELLAEADRRPAAPAHREEASTLQAPLDLGAVTVPPPLAVSRLSYSGLAQYERCGYRFYLERALKLPASDSAPWQPGRGEEPEPPGADELPALLRGTVVHELLEGIDFKRPVTPSEDAVAAAIESHGQPARAEEVADIRDLVEGFCTSELCRRIGRSRRPRTELPFAFAVETGGGRDLLVNGVVDVHVPEADRLLIVDYKSDRLEGGDPSDLVEDKYAAQRLVYALAGLRSGAERAEVAYAVLERPDEPVARAFDADAAPELEAELRDMARGLVGGDFRPSDQPHLELCAGCPGVPGLCVHEPERTLASLPAR